jgi:hypothetical protein
MSALRYVWSRRITRIVGKVCRGYCRTYGEGGRMNEQGWEVGVIELP